MSFVEFVGFIVSFGAMIFLVLRRFFEERQRRLNPEEYERKERIKEENLRRFMRERGIAVNDEEGDDEDFPVEMRRKKSPPVVVKPQTKAQQSQQSQQAFIKLRDAQKQQVSGTLQKKSSSLAFQQGSYGAETASAKKRNMAASDVEHSMHHDFKPADSYEVIRIERITAANRLINGLRSPQDMVILKEILDKPLSMRDE